MLSAHNHHACLLWYQAMGVTDPVGLLPINRLNLTAPKTLVTPVQSLMPQAFTAPTPVISAPIFDPTILNNLNNLADFNLWLQQGDHIHSLAKTAQQAVLGTGPQSPKVVMLAEAPERAEDQSGQAWQTPALQWLQQAWGLAVPHMANHTYYMYLSPWRPPGQRPLTPDELAYCQTLLHKQLQWLNPDFVLSLGSITTRSLSNTPIKNNTKEWLNKNNLPYTNKTKLAPLPSAQNMVMSATSKKAAWQQLLSLAHQL